MIDPALLQSYAARLPKKGRASDAELITPDMYEGDPTLPRPETEPRGLVDRLSQEQTEDQPIRSLEQLGIKPRSQPSRLPTTKRAY